MEKRTKLQTILNDVSNGVFGKMVSAHQWGDDRMTYEQEVGDAWIDVEVREVRLRNGMLILDIDVAVSHEDTRHHSPLLENAIREVLPDWWKVKEEVLAA